MMTRELCRLRILAAVLAVSWLGSADAAAKVELVLPQDNSRFLVGQPLMLLGKLDDDEGLKSFGFEVDRKPICEQSESPYGGVWDTTGAKPKKYQVTFRARLRANLVRSKPVTVELIEPPSDLDIDALCRLQRSRWAFGAATFEPGSDSETCKWLAMAFSQGLTACAYQLPYLPINAPQSARRLVEEDPIWLRRPPSEGLALPLVDVTRDACLVSGKVEVGEGEESKSLPVTVEASVWWAKRGEYVYKHRIEGTLGKLLPMQTELATAILSTMELYLTGDERTRIKRPFHGRYDTYRALNLGHVLATQGKPKEALAQYLAAFRLEPRNPAIAIALSQFRMAHKQFVRAVESAEKAVRLARAEGDPAALQSAHQVLLAAAKLGSDHYGFNRAKERLRCASIVVDMDPTDLVTLTRWAQLVRVLEPTPENFRRVIELGEKVLADEEKLPTTGVRRAVLENVIISHLSIKQDKEAAQWLQRVDQEYELADALGVKFHVYYRAKGREQECLDEGANYIPFAPAEEVAEVVRDMMGVVRKIRGDDAARDFLALRSDEAWQKAQASGKNSAKVTAATILAKAWNDLGDKADCQKWVSEAMDVVEKNADRVIRLPEGLARLHLRGMADDAREQGALDLLYKYPQCPNTQHDLLKEFVKLKKPLLARQAAENIVAQVPDDPVALKYLDRYVRGTEGQP